MIGEEIPGVVDEVETDPITPEVPPEEPTPEDPPTPSVNLESILETVKQGIGGIAPTITVFDPDLIIHINSTLFVLNQLGVADAKFFRITGAKETWTDFLGDDEGTIELVKSYMCLKVKLLFDPPTTGVLHEAMERQISEFEWRIVDEMDRRKYQIKMENEGKEDDDSGSDIFGDFAETWDRWKRE